ncbi:MAG: hypothetical protein RIS70_1641 [Planctomycetota bacterium]
MPPLGKRVCFSDTLPVRMKCSKESSARPNRVRFAFAIEPPIRRIAVPELQRSRVNSLRYRSNVRQLGIGHSSAAHKAHVVMLRMPSEISANVVDDLRSDLGGRAGEVFENLP